MRPQPTSDLQPTTIHYPLSTPATISVAPASRFTCFIVHCLGDFSGRQRRNLVPWRNRPPVKWSYLTSTTSLGASGCHSVDRLVDQRLGPPGAWPVKPGGLM